MPAAAKQVGHILQRRAMRSRPIGCEQAFDVSQQVAGGTINFQEQPKVRKESKENDGQCNGSDNEGSTVYLFS